jgi:hypothetical protein
MRGTLFSGFVVLGGLMLAVVAVAVTLALNG